MSSNNAKFRSISLQSKDDAPLFTCSTDSTPTKALTYHLPDFISMCLYSLETNPHYQKTAVISENWLHAHGVHPNQAHRRAFQDCDFGLLTAYCYPNADETRFRVLCDFINCLFAFDDLTDEGGLRVDADGTRRASDIVMGALCSPHTYETRFKIGRVFADFWTRALISGVAAGTQRRFLEYTKLYLNAVHIQVQYRAEDKLLDVQDFIKLRRDTGALKMCFAMGEYGFGLNVPDEVFAHPVIQEMENMANDVVVLSNDVYSYNIEQAQGDRCNIIEVVMKQHGLGVQDAIIFSGELVKECMRKYDLAKQALPVWGKELDEQVHKYLKVCEDWMTAGFYWSLESKRYFGTDVNRVRETLTVTIHPGLAPRGQEVIDDL